MHTFRCKLGQDMLCLLQTPPLSPNPEHPPARVLALLPVSRGWKADKEGEDSTRAAPAEAQARLCLERRCSLPPLCGQQDSKSPQIPAPG